MPGAIVGAIIADAVGTALASTAFGATSLFGNFTVGKLIGAATGAVAYSLVSSALADSPAQQDTAAADPAVQSQGRLVNVRQPTAPWQIIYGRARVGGVLTYIQSTPADGMDNGLLQIVLTLAGHEVEEIESIWFDDEEIPLDGTLANGGGDATGRLAGYCAIEIALGSETGQPFPGLVAYSGGQWTDAHRQSGRAKIYVRLRFNPDLYPNGVPTITAVVKGRKVYDPRSALTAYSANAALCVNDYFTSTAFGIGATYASEIDETALIAAANDCDDDVTLAAGGTEKRYAVGGAFLASAVPKRTLELLLAAMAGKAVPVGGQWFIYAGAYDAPTVELDESDLAGAIHVQSLISRRESANGTKGTFTAPDTWQPTDFPAIASSTYLAEDGNERVWRDLDLTAFVTSGTQAQRIAKIDLLSVRQGLTVVMPCKLTAWKAVTGRTVAITNTKFGWSSKAFDVQSSRFTVADDGTLGVELSLRETAAAVFDWSTSEEQTVDLAPNSDLPDPFTVAAPGAPVVSEALYETTAQRRVAAVATVSWVGADAFVSTYELQYKLASATEWTTLPRTSAATQDILDIAYGVYDFRVKAVSVIGVSSAWSPTTTKEILGLSARPADLSGLAIQKIGSQALITFTQAADLDVLRGGRILVRHSEATTGATWEASFSIGNERGYPGDAVYVLVPLKAGTYLLKAEDASGQQSETAATIVSDGATALSWSALGSVTEDATFPGTHLNTVAADGVLKLVGTGLVDDIPDFDGIANLDSYGGISAAGTYTFSAGLDLTTKTRAQLYSTLVGVTENVNDLIDERTDDIDDWIDFDGTAGGGSCDAWLEARATDDNPAGSPTWSAWNRLDVSEYNARAFQFRLRIISSDPAYNLLVSQLRAFAQEVV